MKMPDYDVIAAYNDVRRKVSFWRYVAFGGIIIAIIVAGLRITGTDGTSSFVDNVARIHIKGMITGDQQTLDLIQELTEDEQVRAVVMHIDSPGGTTAGSEALYESLVELAEIKPLIAVMDTVAASGGYIAALPATRIFARGNSITGSVGVIFQMPEVSRLMDNLGLRMETIRSGELKAEPSPFSPPSDRARAVSQAMVDDGFKWFSGLVAKHRALSAPNMQLISDGRVFTGRQAVKIGLIDEIGGENQARQWLASKRGISVDMPIYDREPANESAGGLFGVRLLNLGLRAVGLDNLAEMIEKTFVAETLRLDGLLSLWQPNI